MIQNNQAISRNLKFLQSLVKGLSENQTFQTDSLITDLVYKLFALVYGKNIPASYSKSIIDLFKHSQKQNFTLDLAGKYIESGALQ